MLPIVGIVDDFVRRILGFIFYTIIDQFCRTLVLYSKEDFFQDEVKPLVGNTFEFGIESFAVSLKKRKNKNNAIQKHI